MADYGEQWAKQTDVQTFALALEETSRVETAGGAHIAPASEHPVKAGQRPAGNLPEGTVTLLFTDIAGSTRLLQQLGDQYASILTTCRQLLRAAFRQWNGYEVDTQGDSFFVAFARASDAVAAAVTAQRSFHGHPWPDGVAVRVRVALHTGEPERSSCCCWTTLSRCWKPRQVWRNCWLPAIISRCW